MRRVFRMLSFLVLALALIQALGTRMPGFEIACVDVSHHNDGAASSDQDSGCPVTCSCACRAPHRIPLVAPVRLATPAPVPVAYDVVAFAPPPSPAPRPLLHVPRALLG